MKLFGYWRSSSTWRVRIALELKGIAYETVAVNLVQRGGEQHHPGFMERNSLAQVPVLEVEAGADRVCLTQSMAIIEYLDERVPEPPLLPGDALQRARARACAEIVNSGIQPYHNIGFQSELKQSFPRLDARLFSKRFIERGLRALELFALTEARSFLLGEQLTLADLYLVPQLYQARRHDVEVGQYPTLLRIENSCNQLPAFARAHPDRQPDAGTGLPSAGGTQ